MDVVNIPEDVIAEASCALDTAPVAPPTEDTPEVIATLEAEVILPYTSTVITGIFNVLPYVVAATPDIALAASKVV